MLCHDGQAPGTLRVGWQACRRNRGAWDAYAADYADPGRRGWASQEPNWDIFSVPESRLLLLPEELAGKDVVELGCGTAYVSAWLARRGARPVGVDLSEKQLATALSLQREFELLFPLVQANAPVTPVRVPRTAMEEGIPVWATPLPSAPGTGR